MFSWSRSRAVIFKLLLVSSVVMAGIRQDPNAGPGRLFSSAAGLFKKKKKYKNKSHSVTGTGHKLLLKYYHLVLFLLKLTLKILKKIFLKNFKKQRIEEFSKLTSKLRDYSCTNCVHNLLERSSEIKLSVCVIHGVVLQH